MLNEFGKELKLIKLVLQRETPTINERKILFISCNTYEIDETENRKNRNTIPCHQADYQNLLNIELQARKLRAQIL